MLTLEITQKKITENGLHGILLTQSQIFPEPEDTEQMINQIYNS